MSSRLIIKTLQNRQWGENPKLSNKANKAKSIFYSLQLVCDTWIDCFYFYFQPAVVLLQCKDINQIKIIHFIHKLQVCAIHELPLSGEVHWCNQRAEFMSNTNHSFNLQYNAFQTVLLQCPFSFELMQQHARCSSSVKQHK